MTGRSPADDPRSIARPGGGARRRCTPPARSRSRYDPELRRYDADTGQVIHGPSFSVIRQVFDVDARGEESSAMTGAQTATTHGAREHARAQAGARAAAMPVLPASRWPTP